VLTALYIYIFVYYKGVRDGTGENTRLPNPGIDTIAMWVAVVDGSLLFSKRFSLGSVVFPSPQKPTFPYFQFNQENCFVDVLLVHVPLLVLLITDYYIERYLNTCTE